MLRRNRVRIGQNSQRSLPVATVLFEVLQDEWNNGPP